MDGRFSTESHAKREISRGGRSGGMGGMAQSGASTASSYTQLTEYPGVWESLNLAPALGGKNRLDKSTDGFANSSVGDEIANAS